MNFWWFFFSFYAHFQRIYIFISNGCLLGISISIYSLWAWVPLLIVGNQMNTVETFNKENRVKLILERKAILNGMQSSTTLSPMLWINVECGYMNEIWFKSLSMLFFDNIILDLSKKHNQIKIEGLGEISVWTECISVWNLKKI